MSVILHQLLSARKSISAYTQTTTCRLATTTKQTLDDLILCDKCNVQCHSIDDNWQYQNDEQWTNWQISIVHPETLKRQIRPIIQYKHCGYSWYRYLGTVSPQVTIITQWKAAITYCQACSSLLSRWASLPFSQYQIILLGDDRDTCVNNLPRVGYIKVELPGD